ncbi:hypothetical protein FJR11_06445 [Anabaena sp. UHCC 0187]|uniref:hypothetical protein n=1 Tax=Anabaena sp. UHCC 0187 TaxID=2590018 RepID=UPI0014474BA1|nr:hypothetical protein [Anabaena sp. UHCC 0187]MTJ12237.1 hypothetical protein [Anabaena sp. UHCC 0187]
MITLSILDEIAKYLEQHENSKRIKKLIFSACKNIWENDQHTLDRFKLPELIQELCSLNPTIDNLNSSLSSVVNTLNKPGEYSIVADIIVNEIQKLYLTSDEETGILLKQPHQEEETGIVLPQNNPILSYPEKILSNPINKPPSIARKAQYNPFDLRQNLMKYTNPLRAKIILYSALYRKFTFNEQDWFKLRGEKLDSLLQRLFNSCPTLRELESKLNNAVISLGEPDENTQAAGAIIQTMRNLYSEMPASSNSQQSINSYSSPETRTLVNPNHQIPLTDLDDFYDNNDDDNNTCQVIVPPTPDRK